MHKVVCSVLLLAASIMLAATPAYAVGLCREGCYLWCRNNRPTQSCRNACTNRPSCLTLKSKMRGRECVRWCHTHKPGNYGCLGDCVARDHKYGR